MFYIFFFQKWIGKKPLKKNCVLAINDSLPSDFHRLTNDIHLFFQLIEKYLIFILLKLLSFYVICSLQYSILIFCCFTNRKQKTECIHLLFDQFAKNSFALISLVGINRYYDNLEMMFGFRISPIMKICWLFVTPVFTLVSIYID